jgi:CspA family cold shock protein
MRLCIVIALCATALSVASWAPHVAAEAGLAPAPKPRSEQPHCPTGPNLHAGKVRFFDELRGFGFIIPAEGGEEVYVHRTALGSLTIKENDRVVYEVTSGQNGPVAANIRLCGGP